MQDENICIFASWGIYDVVGVLMLSSCKPNQQKVFSGILGYWQTQMRLMSICLTRSCRGKSTWHDMSLLGCRVVRSSEVRWEGQVSDILFKPWILIKTFHTLNSPSNFLGEWEIWSSRNCCGIWTSWVSSWCLQGNFDAAALTEAKMCKDVIYFSWEIGDYVAISGHLGWEEQFVPCSGNNVPLWTSRQIWPNNCWLGLHWRITPPN